MIEVHVPELDICELAYPAAEFVDEAKHELMLVAINRAEQPPPLLQGHEADDLRSAP